MMTPAKWITVIFLISMLVYIDDVFTQPGKVPLLIDPDKAKSPIHMRDSRTSPQQSLEKVFNAAKAKATDITTYFAELHQGDAIMTRDQAATLYGREDPDDHFRSAIPQEEYRWKDAIIPYVLDCSITNLPDALESLHEAIKEWEKKTCLRFVKRTNEKKFLKIFRNTHCWSHVGSVEGASLSIGYGCEFPHVMSHELGHAIGFYHEHNRGDRDNWVNVLWRNIGGFSSAFELAAAGVYHGTQYDMSSIMHYPWNAFSTNGKDTLEPRSRRRAEGATPYQTVSKLDVTQTQRMYKCDDILAKRAAEKAVISIHIGLEKLVPVKSDEGIAAAPSRELYLPDNLSTDKKIDTLMENDMMMMAAPTRTIDPVGTTGCVDWNKNCADWKKSAYCGHKTVRTHCKKTCEIKPECEDKDPEPTGFCLLEEIHSQCPRFAKEGYCCKEKYKKWMKDNCCSSCYPNARKQQTTVDVGSSVKTAPTQGKDGEKYLGVGKLCSDLKGKCSEWAEAGYCENENAKYMAKYCSKSCRGKGKTRCDLPGLQPDDVCAAPLGLASDGTGKFKLPDSAFKSNNGELKNGGWKAHASGARLYFTDDYDRYRIGAWCSPTSDIKINTLQKLTVDLGAKKKITYIATQGRDKYFERTSEFKVEYSDDGRTFKPYTENGKEKIFKGNCDYITPVLNKFAEPIEARYFTYIPWKFNYPCVRMELYGCGFDKPADSKANEPYCGEVKATTTQKPVESDPNCFDKRNLKFCNKYKQNCRKSGAWIKYMRVNCRKLCGLC